MTVLKTDSKQQIIERSEEFLRRLRSTILVWSRGEEDLRGLYDAPEFLRSLADDASEARMGSVPELADKLRHALTRLLNSGSPHPETDALPLLDAIAAVEAEISEFRFGADQFELDISSLLDESFDHVARLRLESDRNGGTHRPPDGVGIDIGVIPAEHPALLQRPHPAEHRRRGDPHCGGEVLVRASSIPLQLGHDLAVGGIQLGHPPSIRPETVRRPGRWPG